MNPPPGARILAAMSGGVDSAVTAILLKEQGYDCIGVTMRLVPEHEGKSVFEPCCGAQAADDARRVCDKIGIPHRTIHCVDRFDRDIIADFVEEYRQGRTPNPCVRCNRLIKFGALYETADELGAEYIAMGHYARLVEVDGRIALKRAAYQPKDQSYVLAPLTQAQLRRALFPLGELTKQEVRAKAMHVDFGAGTKPESQEICFVPDRNYAGFVESRVGVALPGPVVNTRGQVLGEHRGLVHYTVGQRKGLGIAAPYPLYVLKLDVPNNTLVVGYKEETLCGAFHAGPMQWGAMAATGESVRCEVQLHSRHTPAPATFRATPEGVEVELHEPQPSVTPGQWAVFYRDGIVLASAMVCSYQNAALA